VRDRLLADAVVALHLAFILFVVGGGLLVARWRRLAWLHLPALAWGVLVEWAGWICPLTPLENALRARAGLAGYAGGFVEEYLIPVVYPPHLTRVIQVSLGVAAVALNVVVYAWIWRSRQPDNASRP
jgi:Protein of Unknown function (DUF2784)